MKNVSMKSLMGRPPESVVKAVLAESWEYSDANTQQLTHNIHRYSGKFIPQIAARAISILSEPGDLIVDPYCGSGTTLVESALLGRRSIGVDLNPLAVLIAQTKVSPVPEANLQALLDTFKEELAVRAELEAMPLFQTISDEANCAISGDPRFSNEWYQKWFQPTVLADLISIDQIISKLSDEKLRNIAQVAFSDILRKSSNAHSGYPNVMFDKHAPLKARPIRPFLKSLGRVIEMVSTLSGVDASWSKAKPMLGNAAHLPMLDETVDAVISHPPYIGSIPYAEYGSLSLQWLGTDPKALDKELTGGRRQSSDVVGRFANGYSQMLKETARVLRSNRYAFLMVGNPVVRGEVVDLAKMTIDLANQAGLDLLTRTERNGVNRRANKMGAEHLLFFVKSV